VFYHSVNNVRIGSAYAVAVAIENEACLRLPGLSHVSHARA
jgi:hypothetical protein